MGRGGKGVRSFEQKERSTSRRKHPGGTSIRRHPGGTSIRRGGHLPYYPKHITLQFRSMMMIMGRHSRAPTPHPHRDTIVIVHAF